MFRRIIFGVYFTIFSMTSYAELMSGGRNASSDNYVMRSFVGQSGMIPTPLEMRLAPIRSLDLDEDGLDDAWEIEHFGSTSLQSGGDDFDKDGLTNYEEFNNYHSNPTLKDSDRDGMDDFWEAEYDLDPANASDAKSDLDGDGIPAWLEYKSGLNPTINNVIGDDKIDSIDLKVGWNLVAVPIESESVTYSDVFHNTAVGICWSWDSQEQRYIEADDEVVSSCLGIWVFALEDITVPIKVNVD